MNRLYSFLFIFLFSLSACDINNPCKDLACQNGATCNDGLCQCASGFSGDLCQIALPGIVEGGVSPHSVVTGLELTGINTGDIYQANVTSSGLFRFPEAKPGNYTLHVNTNSAYYPSPPDIKVTVIGGDTTYLGIVVPYDGSAQTGTVSFSVNGGPLHTLNDNFIAILSSTHIKVYGLSDGDPRYSFSFEAAWIDGPGTYVIQNGSYLTMEKTPDHWSTHFGGNVIANISSVDPVTKKFSGIFSGTLAPGSSAGDTIQISGSFVDVFGG